MFHNRSTRSPFAVSGNLVATTKTLRGTIDGVISVSGGGVTNVLPIPEDFQITQSNAGTYILNLSSYHSVTLPSVPPVGRWTFIRGPDQDARFALDATNAVLNGVLQTDDSISGVNDVGWRTSEVRFRSSGSPGDTLTLVSDGVSYYFHGESADSGGLMMNSVQLT